jgi:FAD-linked oxidoreductase
VTPQTRAWTNWAGNQVAHPVEVARPASTDEVVETVTRAATDGIPVKAVGTGHSFTDVAVTAGVQVDLSRMSGIIRADRTTGRVRAEAGTPLHVLNPALEAVGLALPNLGDIDRQTIAGAIATGTHGTGGRLHGIAAAVVGLTLVTADGSVLTCSPEEHPEVFHAARVGLGALGVLTEVELRCVPAFRLHADERMWDLDDLLERVDDVVDENDHVDVHWFPHTTRCQVKRNNRVEKPAPGRPGRPLPRWRQRLEDEVLANTAYDAMQRLATWQPRTSRAVNRTATRVLGSRQFTDTSWKVFCSPRDFRFTECEYAVPRPALGPVLAELRAWLARTGWDTTVPVELRFTASDDVWLSTAYERDSAYVAVHQYHRQDNRPYFTAFEDIVREHAGRPHWGKLHRRRSEELRGLYPRFDDVLAVRDRLDPDRLFGNAYLERVLGS